MRRAGRTIRGKLGVLLFVAAGTVVFCSEERSTGEESVEAVAGSISGREIFMREWLPNDSRSHGGDGLGPVFNDSSCIACHNQGGPGGAGPAGKNVDIVSAFLNNPDQFVQPRPSLTKQLFRSLVGLDAVPARTFSKEELEQRKEKFRKELGKIHPGFRAARSVVLHRFATDEKYNSWRQKMLGGNQMFFDLDDDDNLDFTVRGNTVSVDGGITVDTRSFINPTTPERKDGKTRIKRIQRANQEIQRIKTAAQFVNFRGNSAQHGDNVFTTNSQRNPTALFGAGLIDSIPDEVIEAAAKKRYKDFPKVSGRVARLKDKRIGRFGWKAQKASLHDFTLTACAVELGLHVPDHPQSGVPSKPDYKPAGFDLNKQQCDALIDYLRNLPAPQERKPSSKLESEYLNAGEKAFTTVGCAACHTPQLGEADGIYTDLLVHDLGPELGDTGSYGVFIPDSPGGESDEPFPAVTDAFAPKKAKNAQTTKIVGTNRLEWRTPPLWGVRDSAPYLHDGRAQTLEQAIASHGGEATKSARNYFMLSGKERQQVLAFLKSLIAPTQLADAN